MNKLFKDKNNKGIRNNKRIISQNLIEFMFNQRIFYFYYLFDNYLIYFMAILFYLYFYLFYLFYLFFYY
jgi:hypothetical protein